MKLEQLMEGVPYTLVQGSPETEINDIIYDSRKAAPGLLFVCIVGTQRDSHEFAADCAATSSKYVPSASGPRGVSVRFMPCRMGPPRRASRSKSTKPPIPHIGSSS